MKTQAELLRTRLQQMASAAEGGGAMADGGDGTCMRRGDSGYTGYKLPPSEPSGQKSTSSSVRHNSTSEPSDRPTPPSAFVCPITHDLMVDPVMLDTGHTYDRVPIERWLAQGNNTCPVTGQRLRDTAELIPNHALRNALEEWASASGVLLPPRPRVRSSYLERASVRASAHEGREAGDSILHGHSEIIWAILVHGPLVFTASADQTIRVWDSTIRRCVKVLQGHTRPVLCLTASDTHLFSGSYDHNVRVWSFDTLEPVATLAGHTDAVRCMVVVDGMLFTASYDHTVRAWATGAVGALKCCAILVGHEGPVRALEVVGTKLFSASYDKTVRVWDAQTLEPVATLAGHTDAVRALTSVDGRFVVSGSDDMSLRVWDVETLSCVGILMGHCDKIRVLCPLPGARFASGSWDRTVRVWDVDDMSCDAVLEGHTEAVLAVAASGNVLASGSYDTTVRIWDIESMERMRTCHGHGDAVRVLGAAPGIGLMISGSYDGSVGMWSSDVR
ncbi:unnamed protein product [Pedinophyceae sp. YPF-701]|nr:unnamed protein product [Pedinophyceae sp. YPF-701]